MAVDPSLRNILLSNTDALASKKVTLGFDGFVDSVVKVVRRKGDHQSTYFETIDEFGKYTVEKGKSFSLELEESVNKLGGNMPIVAHALAELGTSVSCVGSLGHPSLHPVFQPLSLRAELHSYAEPGLSTAMEFNDGKILLAQMTQLNKADWSTLKTHIGLPALRNLFTNRDLIGMLNWSELDHATDIWKGLLNEIVSKTPIPIVKPFGFFDLCDCSRRSEENITEVLHLISSFSPWWNVVLSMNLNEASIVHKTITKTNLVETDLRSAAENIWNHLRIDSVIIHHAGEAIVRNQNGFSQQNNDIIRNPLLSTGSGDNFNAGYCAGLLLSMDSATCLAMAHGTARHYMQTGSSLSIKNLID